MRGRGYNAEGCDDGKCHQESGLPMTEVDGEDSYHSGDEEIYEKIVLRVFDR